MYLYVFKNYLLLQHIHLHRFYVAILQQYKAPVYLVALMETLLQTLRKLSGWMKIAKKKSSIKMKVEMVNIVKNKTLQPQYLYLL